MVKRILAIDPGTVEMGLYDGEIGYTAIANPKHERPFRLACLAEQLANFMEENGPYDFVVYEEQFVRGGAATKALFGIVGIIEAASINHAGAGVMSLPQGTLREWATKQSAGGLTGKAMYQHLALERDPRLASLAGVTEHIFDAACIYHFIQDNGEIQ